MDELELKYSPVHGDNRADAVDRLLIYKVLAPVEGL